VSLLSSLSNRIFLASALLAVVSIAAAVSLVNLVTTRRAETELERSLNEAGQLVTQFQSLLFQHVVREARLIADLPRLKAAVYEQHAPTAEPVAAEYQAMVEADLFVITNRTGEPLAVVGDPGVPRDAISRREGIREALGGADHVALWSGKDELLQVVTIPIVLESEVLGTLSAGVSLSRRLADRIKQLTRSEVVFFDHGRMLASTLPPGPSAGLYPAVEQDGISHLVIGSQEYVAARRPLSLTSSPTSSGAAGAPGRAERETFALVLLSRTEHLAFLRTLHSGLALTAVLAVLLATLLSYAVSRTITRPVRALTASMREMAATGNLSPPPPTRATSRWEDEDAGVLTRTFDTLTQSLARFQREAAQRERLSSLGRLSTVLAHEIRNPLMIIKASVRTLRRGATDPQAVDDIEGEVNRLNRLVHEVLDYARPITYAKDDVDLGRLVRDAAHAVAAGQPGPEIAVEAPVGLELHTDVERLRQALINVLDNARDAVLAHQRANTSAGAVGIPGFVDGVATAPIRVSVTAVASQPIEIAVRDSGVGMPAEDVARMFDPFFTTKQTGSGIGLAITRNIVEGLGGRIDVESRPGRGTTVRFVLPR
jgi:signal transduction histidine kinase